MALDDETLKRMAALQAAAVCMGGLSGTPEDVLITADMFLNQWINKPRDTPAQALAYRAYYCEDKESFTKVWHEARDGGLMHDVVTLGAMTGPLGEYLTHKSGLLKQSEETGFVDHPASEGVRGDLNL